MRPRRYQSSRCTICRRPDRAAVEGALALGLSCASVAARFDCGEDSLWRHRRGHMDAAHTAAVLIARKPPAEIDLEALQKIEADRLLAELVDARVRCRAIRDLALAQGGFGLALQAEASIRSALAMEMQLLAPLLGPLVKAADIDSEVIKRIEIVAVPAPEPALEPEPATPSEPLEPDALAAAFRACSHRCSPRPSAPPTF